MKSTPELRQAVVDQLAADRAFGYTSEELRRRLAIPHDKLWDLLYAIGDLLEAGLLRLIDTTRLSAGRTEWDAETAYRAAWDCQDGKPIITR